MAMSGGLLLAACGGDTVKLFDTAAAAAAATEPSGDPCLVQYSPSPDLQLNCVRWNHTNMVVASAGEDRKISLWTKKFQSVMTVENDASDPVDETIMAVNFSTKSSRYLCSGGTGKVVRVWDMQRKRCIKWLKGHVDTITDVMYNCKDEHIASISVGGDLILHNLASGSRVAELRDPHHQVLRVLEFSRLSRHLLVTSGDDGSVHLWDTTSRSPKVSWIKQHSAPATGLCFSPPNDKVVASLGLDKKLYIFDTGTKRPVHTISCETPYSSAAFRDDGVILAAGTNSGRVVFYDIRGKPQPCTVLRAYGPSKAVTSLSWQRLNPALVNEKTCTAELALLGPGGDDPIVMPDPLPPPVTGRGRAANLTLPVRSFGRSTLSNSGSSTILRPPTGEETPSNHLVTNGNISRLHISRSEFSSKDDMEVFSPLVDVQPIVPSVTKYWDFTADSKKDPEGNGSQKYLSGAYKFSTAEEGKDATRQNLERKIGSHQSPVPCTPPAVFVKDDRSPSVTPPEAWGGDGLADRGSLRVQVSHTTSRFASGTSSASAALSGHGRSDGLAGSGYPEVSPAPADCWSSGSPVKNPQGDQENASLNSLSVESSRAPLDRSHSWGSVTLAEQFQLSSSSPRRKDKKDDEVALDENVENGSDSKFDYSGTNHASSNGQFHSHSPQQQGAPPFALQLVQRALEESLSGIHKSIHEDVHNLHLELLRQFHLQQSEMEAMMEKVLAKQTEVMEEIQALRREHQQLRQYL